MCCCRRVSPLHFEKIQIHDYHEASGWEFSSNLLICENIASETIFFLAQGVNENEACWFDVYPEALIGKQLFNMTSSMFSYLTVFIQTGKPFGLSKVFSHMAVHSFSSSYFLINFSYL